MTKDKESLVSEDTLKYVLDVVQKMEARGLFSHLDPTFSRNTTPEPNLEVGAVNGR